MLKLIVLATIIAIAFGQLDTLKSSLPTKEKCDSFVTADGVDENGCRQVGCGVCATGEVLSCRQRFIITTEGLTTTVDTNSTCPAPESHWVEPRLADVIPPLVYAEYQYNRDVALSEEEKAAINQAVMAKVAELKEKCDVPDAKAACIAAFNAWLGDQAETTELAIKQKLEEYRQQWVDFTAQLREEFNATKERDEERDRCQQLPESTKAERAAKLLCIYNRQKAVLAVFKIRVLALQKVLEFHRFQALIFVRLARDQLNAALAVPVVAGIDLLREFRETLVEKLRDFVVLTITLNKLKEKIEQVVINRDKALAYLENVKARADELNQNIEREVKTAIAEIKQKIDDFRTAVRDFAKAYVTGALECKSTVTNTATSSTVVVSCSVELKDGETKDSVKERFRKEVEAIIRSNTGVEVTATTAVDVVDPELQPQSAKRGVLQNNAPLSSSAVLDSPDAGTTGSAATTVLSITLMLLAIFAMLF